MVESIEFRQYIAMSEPDSLTVGFEQHEEDYLRGTFHEALTDLRSCSGQLDFPIGTCIVRPEFKLLSLKTGEKAIERGLFGAKYSRNWQQRKKWPFANIRVFRIAVTIPLQSQLEVIQESQRENESPCFDLSIENFAPVLIESDLSKLLSDLLILMNIAYPGAIGGSAVSLFQDGNRTWCALPRMKESILQMSVCRALRMKWPDVSNLSVQSVWTWYLCHRDVLQGFDGTPLGRAMCAFSHLFDVDIEYHPMRLLWALVGLESLYTTGRGEKLEQLRERSQALLGSQDTFKKAIPQMYNFRSRFVHGDLDFPGLLLTEDARDTVDRYYEELQEATEIACAVLTATLQDIVRRNWSGLSFKCTVGDVES